MNAKLETDIWKGLFKAWAYTTLGWVVWLLGSQAIGALQAASFFADVTWLGVLGMWTAYVIDKSSSAIKNVFS